MTKILTILALLPKTATFYFCKANIPRGLDVDELENKALNFGLNGGKYSSVTEAFHAAKEAAGEDDLVFVGGSTFIVSRSAIISHR